MARRITVPQVKSLATLAPSTLKPRVPVRISARVPKLPDPDEPDVFEEMTLLEHMEELRDRIIKSIIAVGLAFVVGILAAGPMLKRLQIEANAVGGFDVVSPTDPITLYFKVALYIAIGLALPVILWELVGFLLPGLTKKEKRFLILSLPFVIVLFLLGVAYGFFFAAPRALQFLSGFMSDLYEWSPEGDETISFFLTLMLGLGLAFQLPVVMFILAKLGIASAQKMRSWWRYALVILLIVSAIVTPSTDPINMMVVFVPLFLLYVAGILVAHLFAQTPVERSVAG